MRDGQGQVSHAQEGRAELAGKIFRVIFCVFMRLSFRDLYRDLKSPSEIGAASGSQSLL